MEKTKAYFKYIGIAGCVIAMIGTFIPWVSAMGYTATIMDRLGIYFILLSIATGVLFFLDSALFALIATVLSAIWLATNAFMLFGNQYVVLTPGAGLFIAIVGIAVAAVSSILMLISSKKEVHNGQF